MTDRNETNRPDNSTIAPSQRPFFVVNSALEYWIGAWQRRPLFLDILRQRGGWRTSEEVGRVDTLLVGGWGSRMTGETVYEDAGLHIVA